MPVDFAAAEARLGASIRARLGNASITLENNAVVDGRLHDRGRDAQVGSGMAGRVIEFAGALAQLSSLAEGDAVTLTYRGVSSSYLVAERLPDDVHLQEAIVLLQKAAL